MCVYVHISFPYLHVRPAHGLLSRDLLVQAGQHRLELGHLHAV